MEAHNVAEVVKATKRAIDDHLYDGKDGQDSKDVDQAYLQHEVVSDTRAVLDKGILLEQVFFLLFLNFSHHALELVIVIFVSHSRWHRLIFFLFI